MPMPAAPAPRMTTRWSLERHARDAGRGEDAGEHDGAGALDVVVERGQHLAVAVQQVEGVLLLEILPLEQRAGKAPAHGDDELLHDRVVLGPAQAPVGPAQIQVVVEQRLVVRAHVQADGQGMARIDARRSGIDGDLADRDAHAACTLVAQAQNALIVRDDDEPHVLARPVAQHLIDAAAMLRRDPEPPRPTEDVAELLAGAAHRRGVDDGEKFLQVLAQHVMEQVLVAVLERGEPDVALERIGLAREVLVDAPRLLLERVDRRGQETLETEGQPLLPGEGGALVVERVPKDLGTGVRDLRRLVSH